MKVQIITNVVNGSLKRNRSLVKEALATFENKTIRLTIEKATKKRSNPQNAYYWSVIIPIFRNAIKNEWGEVWGVEKAHETLKSKFNYTEKVNENTGEILNVVKSTTENTTTQQEEYHEKIRQFVREWFNVEIPLPNEHLTLEL